MTTITTPASLDAAVAELNGLSELLTATEWHRAAIVATHVRLDQGSGGREVSTGGHFRSARGFADLGIHGLGSPTSVSHYVQCWLDECGDYPAQGVTVLLPEVPWPPQKRNQGTRVTTSSVARRLVEDEDFAREVLTDAILSSPVVANIVRDALMARLPKTARAEVAASHGAEVITDAAVVRHGSYLLRALTAMEDGTYQPDPKAALILAVVRPRHDWDAELAVLTDGSR